MSASTGPYAAHGNRHSQARIFRSTGAEWEPVTDELAAMPYALTVADGRVFAGLGNGTVLETRDGGDSWTELRLAGDGLPALHALAH